MPVGAVPCFVIAFDGPRPQLRGDQPGRATSNRPQAAARSAPERGQRGQRGAWKATRGPGRRRRAGKATPGREGDARSITLTIMPIPNDVTDIECAGRATLAV